MFLVLHTFFHGAKVKHSSAIYQQEYIFYKKVCSEDTAINWQSSTPYLQCEKYGGIALIVRKHHHPADKF